MRKQIMTAILALAMLTGIILAFTLPAQSHAKATATPVPTATPSYPACLTEDGAGQALCWWDAQTQGNGQGHSVVSGDCALSVVSTEAVQAVCLALHKQDSSEHEYQGAMVTIPNGVELVQECNDELPDANGDKGWSLIECYKAWM